MLKLVYSRGFQLKLSDRYRKSWGEWGWGVKECLRFMVELDFDRYSTRIVIYPIAADKTPPYVALEHSWNKGENTLGA